MPRASRTEDNLQSSISAPAHGRTKIEAKGSLAGSLASAPAGTLS